MPSFYLTPMTRGLITLYTSTLLAGMWSMIVPAVPVIAQSFGVSAGTGAQIVTALAVGRFAGMPISGAVLDHLGTRSALVAGPALGCTAGLIAAGVPRFGLILALVFLMGVAESIWVIAREVSGIDLARVDQRGRVLSGFHGVNNVGLALGPLVGGLLTESVGFRATFVGYAICAAASVLIGLGASGAVQGSWFNVQSPRTHPVGNSAKEDSPRRRGARGRFLFQLSLRPQRCGTLPGGHPEANAEASRFRKWRRKTDSSALPQNDPSIIVRLKRWLRGLHDLFHQIDPQLRATYWVIVFATFTSFVHRSTTQSMLPLYGSLKLGLSPKEIGLLFTISGISVFAMILPAGYIIDKIGRKWATVPSTGIPAIAFLLIPFSGSFTHLAVLVSFLGISNGLSLGSLATSTYDVVPAHARGRLQAARRTMAETGSITAPLLGGFLADSFAPGIPFLSYAPLLIISALLLAMVARETLDR
jgi:MFS family permease